MLSFILQPPCTAAPVIAIMSQKYAHGTVSFTTKPPQWPALLTCPCAVILPLYRPWSSPGLVSLFQAKARGQGVRMVG
jgi:hypothetical protein